MKKQSKKYKDQLGLEGDGIIENFFHVLWAKDPIFGTIPSVYVPHTVILSFNEPIAWYFMKNGALKKKTRKNLTQEHIKEVFIRNKSPSGIVAVFMRYKKQENNDKPDVVFEYFNEKEFLEFMNNNRQVNNGILQQFIQPKGDKNYLITANWSPKLCFFEKTESLTKINDQKHDVYDRALTIEAENYHSKDGPLRGYVLPNKIQRICANIAQHVQNVSFESILIARMILQFKVDTENRIWFLVCTSLRLDHSSEERITTRLNFCTEQVQMKYKPEDYLTKITTPSHIKTNIIKGKPVNMHKIFSCLNCSIRLEPNSVFETSYKTIIEGYEWDHLRDKHRSNENNVVKPKYNNIDEILKRLQGAPLEVDDSLEGQVTSIIPPLIRRLYPNMRDGIYITLRNHLGFLNKTTVLCEECVLQIQQSTDVALKAQKQSSKDFYGTGKLKPETLKARYEYTVSKMRHKGPSQTMTSFPKFYFSSKVKAEETTLLKSVRSKRHSELPLIFSELQGTKDLITMNHDDNNDDDENLSVDSHNETKKPISLSNRVVVPVKEVRPVSLSIKLVPQENRHKSVKSARFVDIDRPKISISSSNKKLLIEDLSKKENSNSSNSGFLSSRSEKIRVKSYAGPSKDAKDLVVTQTSSNLMDTLSHYMPKKAFLKSKYQSLRSLSGANTERTVEADTIDKIFETEGSQSIREYSYHEKYKKSDYGFEINNRKI